MTFRDEILAIAKECSLTELGVLDRIGLRIILRRAPDQLAAELFNQAQAEGKIPKDVTLKSPKDATTAVDWTALAEFIKVVLPLIIQAILAFR